ncbi:MAG: hypothetical protein IJ944_06070 [Clostridia bacterium]|nr:hypothetical protein [Clostridia bacterium]
MKRIIPLTLALVLLISIFSVIPVYASNSMAGDINKDGVIDTKDALLALQHSVSKVALDFDALHLSDINTDGETTSADALLILQRSVGKLTEFENGQQITETTYNVGEAALDNNAYKDELSADTSFVIDNVGLEKNTIYYVSFSSAPSVHFQRMMYALQGIINRDFGRDTNHTTLLYFYYDGSDPHWYNYITKEGNYFEGINKITITTTNQFLETFKNQIKQCGYVVWDPNVPATSNVALTICGIEGYLPVQAGTDAVTLLKNVGAKEKMSLVGMFKDNAQSLPGSTTPSSKSAKNDAYLWTLDKYFDRCSSTYLAYILDGSNDVATSPFSQTSETYRRCYQNYDYIVARRAFAFDLDPYSEEAACDDPNQKIGTDHQTMRKIFSRRYDRANGDFGQLLGFPPWWLKYSSNVSLPNGTPAGSKPATWIEWYFSELITCYNLAKEADAAGLCQMSNGSVYYKYRVDKDFEFKNNRPEPMTFDPDVHYFTIYMGDYDSSAWLKVLVYNQWMAGGGDKARGTLPLCWAYNSNLSYRVPMVFQYIYENKTANDYFVSGDSGAGYVIPAALQNGRFLAYTSAVRNPNYTDGLDKWAEYSRSFFDLFDYDITGFIINGANPMTYKIFECFNKISPVGSFHNDASQKLTVYNGVPYVHLHNGIDNSTPESTIYSYSFTEMGAYNFSGFRTVTLSPTNVKTLVNNYISYAATKGKTVQFVDMYSIFSLIRQSGQGKIVNQ